MLNEAPEKQKEVKPLTKMRLFRRNTWECFRRAVTPFLMYFFMSLIMIACQAIGSAWARIILGILCILAGAFFNGHLLYHCGVKHYSDFLSGEARRRDVLFGAKDTADHHPEREYRPWKGFVIGFFVGLPVLILGTLSGFFYDRLGGDISGSTGASFSQLALVMLAGWAIVPVTWFGSRTNAEGVPVGLKASPFWSLLFILLPIAVSGVFYIIGALRERDRRLETEARVERVKAAREEARQRAQQEAQQHIQTEEQRKKTLQSKKKK